MRFRILLVSFSFIAACGNRLAPLGATTPAPAFSTTPTTLTDAQKRRDATAAPRVQALLDAYGNGAPVLSPDGTKVLFRSARGGVPELYLADVAHPNEPARKLVRGPERVGSAAFTADGASILYRKDSGADENFHIFRVALDGTGNTDLTPGQPLWRDTPLVPRGKPDTMVYAARKTTDYASQILVQNLSGGAPKVVYRDPAPGTAIDVSSDGQRALWVREARGGHELLEVDLATGKARLLAPLDGRPARITTAAYSMDGHRVFVATDGGSESCALVALDVASLTQLAEYRQASPATAAVGAVVPSPRGDRLAILVDAGNRSTVRVLNATTLAVTTDVKMPLGAATLGVDTEVRFPLGAGTFAPDGSHFVMGFSSPDAPDDIYLVAVATGEVQPLRSEPRAGLERLPPITASIEEVKAFDGLTIPVNLYLPRSADATKKLPTIVYFHGGPDASTSFEWNAWTRIFTTHGFAVVEPNIRGSTGFGRAYEKADDREKRADALKDVESVNAWARAQSWCDPDRLIIEGASYGGYVVLLALTRQPTRWSAGVDLAGISDLTTMLASAASPKRYLAEFGDPRRDAELLARFSPLRDADRIVAPLFVYQGQNDARVPRSHADRIVRALRGRHIPVEYMVAPNEGHTVAHRENQVEFLTRVLRFLDDELHLTR